MRLLIMNPFGAFRVTSLLVLLTIHVLVWHPNSISGQGWADEDASEGMINDVSSFPDSIPEFLILFSHVPGVPSQKEPSSLTIDVLIRVLCYPFAWHHHLSS